MDTSVVSSCFEDDPGAAVTLDATFGTLQDGTSCPAKIEFVGQARDREVVIENAGYRESES